MAAPFRIAFVPGVTPGKWLRTWKERRLGPLEASLVEEAEQRRVLDEDRADMCFMRQAVDRDGLHLIPLYDEKPVVVVPKDHPATVYDSITESDLEGEIRLHVSADLTAKQAIETVAAGTGVVVVPMSVARLHHRRDVAFVVVDDLPETSVGLAWRKDRDDDRFEQFIGVVRGRTPRSSRGGR